MIVDNKFEIRETVYLLTDPESLPRIITAFYVRDKDITYELTCATDSTIHYEFEISTTKNY